MKIKQIKGGGRDKDLVDKMSKFKFCKIKNIYKLKHQIKTVVYFFSIFLVRYYVVVNHFSILVNKVDINETTFTTNFEREASF